MLDESNTKPRIEVEIADKVAMDPLWHLTDVQGISSLETYQKHIVKTIRDYDRVCIKACHNIGKTFLMARIVLWFLSSHYRSRVITTAPTTRQVKHLLWAEINAGYKYSRVPLGGEMYTTMWKVAPDWFAIGFASKPSAGMDGDNSNFQGWHAEDLLIVMDEATGIDAKIWTQSEGMMTSGNVKFIAVGNPTSIQSVFYDKFHSPLWHKISLSCFDSPNLNKNNLRSIEDLRTELDLLKTLSDLELEERLKSYKVFKKHLLTARWVMEFAYDWGIDHPLFQGKVLGEFPSSEENTLFPLHIIEASQLRTNDIKYHTFGQNKGDWNLDTTKSVHIGVDVARMGSDKTIIQSVYHNTVFNPTKLIKKDNVEVAGWVLREIRKFDEYPNLVKTVTVDSTGLGSGVMDTLKGWQLSGQIPAGIKIREAHFGAAVVSRKGKEHYANYKAKIYCELAEDIRASLILPDDQIYQQQLPSIKHRTDAKGRIIIESKDDYKKRTGRGSPDEADALALANDGKRSYDLTMDFNIVEFGSIEKSSAWSL